MQESLYISPLIIFANQFGLENKEDDIGLDLSDPEDLPPELLNYLKEQQESTPASQTPQEDLPEVDWSMFEEPEDDEPIPVKAPVKDPPATEQPAPAQTSDNDSLILTKLAKKYKFADLIDADKTVTNALAELYGGEDDSNFAELAGLAIGKLQNINLNRITDKNDLELLSSSIEKTINSLQEELNNLPEEEITLANNALYVQVNAYSFLDKVAVESGFIDVKAANEAVKKALIIDKGQEGFASVIGFAIGKLKNIKIDNIKDDYLRKYINIAVIKILSDFNNEFNTLAPEEKNEASEIIFSQDDSLKWFNEISNTYHYQSMEEANNAIKAAYQAKASSDENFPILVGVAIGKLSLVNIKEIEELKIKNRASKVIPRLKKALKQELIQLSSDAQAAANKKALTVIQEGDQRRYQELRSDKTPNAKYIRNKSVKLVRENRIPKDQAEELVKQDIPKIQEIVKSLVKKLYPEQSNNFELNLNINQDVVNTLLKSKSASLDNIEQIILEKRSGVKTPVQVIEDRYSYVPLEDGDKETWPDAVEYLETVTKDDIVEGLTKASEEKVDSILGFIERSNEFFELLSAGDMEASDMYDDLVLDGLNILNSAQEDEFDDVIYENLYLLFQGLRETGKQLNKNPDQLLEDYTPAGIQGEEAAKKELAYGGGMTAPGKEKPRSKDERSRDNVFRRDQAQKASKEYNARLRGSGTNIEPSEFSKEKNRIRKAGDQFNRRLILKFKNIASNLTFTEEDQKEAKRYFSIFRKNIEAVFTKLKESWLDDTTKNLLGQEIITNTKELYLSELTSLIESNGTNQQVKSYLQLFLDTLNVNIEKGKAEADLKEVVKQEVPQAQIDFEKTRKNKFSSIIEFANYLKKKSYLL